MHKTKTILLVLGWLLPLLLFPWLVMGPTGPGLARLWERGVAHLPALLQKFLSPGWMHAFLFVLLAVPGSFLLKVARPSLRWGMAVLLNALAFGLAYKIAVFLPEISTYPFSLGWSEGSRFYYASLYLSEQIYGLRVPPSILHPSRYLLQAIPFLIPNSPLWLHRFWQVLLWLVTSGLTAWLLTMRAAAGQSISIRLALAMGAILFLFQGPVYYHLLVMVILVLWGYDQHHPWRTMGVVALASLWAGISRVNWLPVPGLLAAAMYILYEKSFKSLQQSDAIKLPDRSDNFSLQGAVQRFTSLLHGTIQYLRLPVAWTVAGTLLAWISQQVYQAISGNPPGFFGSSFSSDLLWYRLLPNPTYPLGVLPSALLVSLPVLGLMALRLQPSWHSYYPQRFIGLGSILLVLFTGGVVVSVKIGGGSNLHNLDAYLVLLLVIASFVLFNFPPDLPLPTGQLDDASRDEFSLRGSSGKWLPAAVGLAAALPILFAITAGGPWPIRSQSLAVDDLLILRQAAEQAVQNGGQVLMINQRHLLTFDQIAAPMSPDYELVFLMEMAMAGNPAYLDAFHHDLESHRYALIIAEPLIVQYQGQARAFGEENDAWVEQVSAPVLCNYRPLAFLQTAGVVLYVPSQSTCP